MSTKIKRITWIIMAVLVINSALSLPFSVLSPKVQAAGGNKNKEKHNKVSPDL